MSVIATMASNIAMSTYCPSPVRSRWRSAARMPITPNSAESDVAERADRDRDAAARRRRLVVVDARHRLDDRRVRGPVAVRRPPCCRSPRSTRRSRRGGPRRRRRSRGPCGPCVPGLKFSATTSKCGTSARNSSRPSAVFRSMPTLRLFEGCCAGRWRRRCGPRGRPSPGCDAAARLAVHGVLDLHDVGAEAGQQLRRVRQRLHLLGREHAHAVERLAVLRRVLVRHVAESHRRSLPGVSGAGYRGRDRPPDRI